MFGQRLKVVIVGASSLLGKELSEELTESVLADAEVLLVDAELVEGQVATAGDEASFIQKIGPASFQSADFAFFAGSVEQTKDHWKVARQAGATVVDLTNALGEETEVITWSAWLAPLTKVQTTSREMFSGKRPDLQTVAVVAAHPIATTLALLAAKLTNGVARPRTIVATVLQPASEFGQPGMDELHQQTVNLLSFKDLPEEVFDAQAGFNVLASFGEDAEVSLRSIASTIETQYAALSNGQLPELNLQLLQVPVFHGYLASVLVDFTEPVGMAAVEAAVNGGKIELVSGPALPSNLLVAGRRDLLVSVQPAMARELGEQATRFWFCLAADNLKIAAANAIDCALAMRSLRPQGKVQ